MNRRSINFNSILDWTFLILSIACICVVTPMSYTSDKKPDQPSTKSDINVELFNQSSKNYEKFLELLNSENKSIDMIFNYEVPVPESFIPAIKNATVRGVKVRMYTMEPNSTLPKLTLPEGAEIRYFKNTTYFKKFYVNFAIFHSELLFFPSSFIPRIGFDKKIIGFYADTNDKNLISSAQVVFDYFWNMGDEMYFVLPRKYFFAYENSDFTLDPDTELALNITSIHKTVRNALDQSAEVKIVASRQFFPDNITNFTECLRYAQISSLLEKQAITDLKLRIILSESEFITHKTHYVSIYHNFADKENIDLRHCTFEDIDGTIIAATDQLVLLPCGLDEITHNNNIIFGLSHKTYIINDITRYGISCPRYPKY